ncbi:uncharacterized protein N7515_005236, partial [Penicillium bovifimosum]
MEKSKIFANWHADLTSPVQRFLPAFPQHRIIPICMPPHSSHLLQPLDVGCFAVLKRSYGRFVEMKMRNRIDHIDKLDFLEAYPLARIETFKSETIKIASQQLVYYLLHQIECSQ